MCLALYSYNLVDLRPHYLDYRRRTVYNTGTRAPYVGSFKISANDLYAVFSRVTKQ